MKHGRLWGISIGLCIGAGLLTWHLAFSQPTDRSELIFGSCALDSLNGRYMFAADGYDPHGKIFAFSGLEVYTGDGTMTGVYSGSTDGTIVHNVAYTGTYTVKSNCTIALTTTEVQSGIVVHYDMFIGPTGNEFSWVQTDPGATLAGFERRVR